MAGEVSILDGILEFGRRARGPAALSWVAADQAIVSGSNFLTGVIIARTLGIAEFGVFSLLWLGVLFVQSIQFALLLSPMTTIGPKQAAADAPRYYSAMALQQLFLCGLSSVLVFVFFLFEQTFALNWITPKTLIAWAICIFVTQIHEFLRRYNFSLHNSRTVFLSDVVRNSAQLITLLAMLLRYPDVGVTGILLMIAASAVIAILPMIEDLPPLRFGAKHSIAVSRRQVRFTKWLLASTLLQWLTGNLFTLVSGAVLGPIAVGGLKAAQTLIAVSHIFFLALENVVPVRASRIYHTQGRAALNAFLSRIGVYGALSAAVVGLLFALPAHLWLGGLFGVEYGAYGYLVAGYALTYLLMAGVVPLRFYFITTEGNATDIHR